MSKYYKYPIIVKTGCDIVKCLHDFAESWKLEAAFLVTCDGKISKATLRMANAAALYEPLREIREEAEIMSLVGTISGGNGHLHAYLHVEAGETVGGHVFGPLVASGNVHVTIGEGKNLKFIRLYDKTSGYPELVVQDNLEEKNECCTKDFLEHFPTCDNEVIIFALRLKPRDEIGVGIHDFVLKNDLKEPFIITCVGSVTTAFIKPHQTDEEVNMVSNGEVRKMQGYFEIVSLQGTPDNLTISLSDKLGYVTHGHVTGDLIVFTTCEVVLGEKLKEKLFISS